MTARGQDSLAGWLIGVGGAPGANSLSGTTAEAVMAGVRRMEGTAGAPIGRGKKFLSFVSVYVLRVLANLNLERAVELRGERRTAALA